MSSTVAGKTRCYSEIASLLWKHGLWSFGKSLGLQDVQAGAAESLHVRRDGSSPDPEALADDIEKLGPIYIKFAQIAATRKDLVPAEYCQAFRRLQDDVAPITVEEIYSVLEQELGASVATMFSTFDPKPLATASIAQVHRATLRDGREVVVKIQKPGILPKAEEQLECLQQLSDMADKATDFGRAMRFGSMVRAVAYAFSSEVDFRNEARNLIQLRQNLSEFDAVQIPRVYESFTRPRVVVMEYISGTPIDKMSGVVLNEIDTVPIAKQLVHAYLKQTLIDGIFHADPHPGNLLLTREHRVAILDGGMVVRLSPTTRSSLGMLVLSISEGDGESVGNIAAEVGFQEANFDRVSFRKSIGQIVAHTQIGQGKGISIGQSMIRLVSAAGRSGLTMPAELILFTKALLQMEETLLKLNPSMHLGELVKEFCPEIMRAKAFEGLSLTKFTQKAFEVADLSAELPRRLNRITQQLADNEFKIRVDTIDERSLIAGIEKVANRIAAGLVSAALIVAASILMNIESIRDSGAAWSIAIAFFILAASVGLYLIYRSIATDHVPVTRN